MMDEKMKEKYCAEAEKFISGVAAAKVLKPELDEMRWFGNFGPLLFVVYCQYLSHFYNELSTEEIDGLCESYIHRMGFSDEATAQRLLSQMKGTNRDYPKIMGILRRDGLDYGSAAGMVPYFLFQLPLDAEGCLKISRLADETCNYRNEVDEAVMRAGDAIIKIADSITGDMLTACRANGFEGAHQEPFFFAFGLYCCKYFIHHTTTPELFMKYRGRGYITQHFIKLLIAKRFGTGTEDATYCYSLWNHLVKSVDLTSKENNAYQVAFVHTVANAVNYGDSFPKSLFDLSLQLGRKLDALSLSFK